MEAMAQFERVSQQRFESDLGKTSDLSTFEGVYDGIELPVRATVGSAGYDFFAPFGFELAPGKSISVPTGIRAKINPGWVLCLFPRSGLGFKFRLQLDNTVGIIDSDYYHSANEGHIIVKLSNLSLEGKTVTVEKGKAFCQGVFLPFGITFDDGACGVRNGGFGSTK